MFTVSFIDLLCLSVSEQDILKRKKNKFDRKIPLLKKDRQVLVDQICGENIKSSKSLNHSPPYQIPIDISGGSQILLVLVVCFSFFENEMQ